MKQLLLLMLTILLNAPAHAQGYDIRFTLKNFSGDTVYLGYHLGARQYIADTTGKVQGEFRFKGDKPLSPGLYMVILPPKNDYFEFLVDRAEQSFSIDLDANDFVRTAKVKGSKDNQLYMDYMKFLTTKREESKPLSDKIDFHKNNPEATEYKIAEKGLANLDAEVKAYQRKLIKEHPKTFTASLLRANLEPEIPEAINAMTDEKARKLATFYYYKESYLKGINFADERLVRTPILHQRIEYYLEKLTQPQPDSIILSVDVILSLTQQNKEVHQYAASELLNKFAKSKTICFDAIYVHIADKYYCNPKGPFGGAVWVEKEALKKICDNAEKLRPILCNKLAPNVELASLPLSAVKITSISDVKANYTVLVFWKHDCTNCIKTISQLSEKYEKLKTKGAEILFVAINQKEDATIVEQKLKEANAKGIFVLDTERTAQKAYDVLTTPLIYLLDKDKKILFKRLDVNQVLEIVESQTR